VRPSVIARERVTIGHVFFAVEILGEELPGKSDPRWPEEPSNGYELCSISAS
jgi:hypothetical protein